MTARRRFEQLIPVSQGEMRNFGRLLVIYSVLGIVVGVFASGFNWLVHEASALLIAPHVASNGADLGWPTADRLWLLILPAAGGLATGLLCARLAPEVMGSGIGHVIESYLTRDGEMRRRVPGLKALASTLTLGTGGSGGIEGPIGQIAAGLGSWFGGLADGSLADRRVLAMAGFAAGIGAVFHAPMAAAILAAEILYLQMDIEHEVLVPAIIASTVSHAVYGAISGWNPLLVVPPVAFNDGFELIPYLVLAIVVALAGTVFVAAVRWVSITVGRSPRLPLWVRPAIGGLGVGLIGLFVPQALGAGYGIVEIALSGSATPLILLALGVAKLLAAALTTGSGGAGGLFAPSLVIGGALGAIVGELTAQIAPGLDVQPAAFVVVGMAGLLAAVSNTPLSTVIMVSELIGSYRLVVPALWVCVLAWMLTRRRTLFPEQVNSRLDARFRVGDTMGAVLHRISVREALTPDAPQPVTVPPDLPLRQLVEVFAQSHQAVFPIRDASQRLLGVVDGRQLRRTLSETDVNTMLIAGDFQAPALTITPSDTLHDAITRMTASGYDDLVVVSEDHPDTLVGILSRREVVGAYHRKMLERAPGQPDAEHPTVEEPTIENDLGAALHRGGIHAISAHDREEALRTLMARARLPEGSDRERLVGMLLAREALGSTGVGEGIAVPHPHAEQMLGVGKPMVIIGLLDAPVEWDAFDDKPVDVVAILLCPSGDTHLALLGSLARCLNDAEVRDLLHKRAPMSVVLKKVWEIVPPQ